MAKSYRTIKSSAGKTSVNRRKIRMAARAASSASEAPVSAKGFKAKALRKKGLGVALKKSHTKVIGPRAMSAAIHQPSVLRAPVWNDGEDDSKNKLAR